MTVNFASADGTATAAGPNSDYTATSGTLTFTPGQTTKTVTVLVNGDITDEIDESFQVDLSTPVAATILDGQGLGRITDDDGFPSLSVNDVGVTEANGASVNANFTVTLSNASGQTVNVDYATSDGNAKAGSDYTSASGTLEFAPGQLTRTITVPVTGDLLDEPDESFNVTLSNAVHATINDGTSASARSPTTTRPRRCRSTTRRSTKATLGTGAAIFTVTLNAPSGREVTVDFGTLNVNASAPADYAANERPALVRPG